MVLNIERTIKIAIMCYEIIHFLSEILLLQKWHFSPILIHWKMKIFWVFLRYANISNIENVIKFSNLPIFYTNVNIHIIGNIICVIFYTMSWTNIKIRCFEHNKNIFVNVNSNKIVSRNQKQIRMFFLKGQEKDRER